MSTLISYASRDLMMSAVAAIIAGQLDDKIKATGAATLAVPGGTTPGPLFDVLAKASIAWAKVTILLTDERWVPETSPRSNIALVRARLLQGPAAMAHFVGFDAVKKTPEDALEHLTARLAPHLPLTVVLLGMGADMHTASLFPGADRLIDALADDAPPLLPMRASGAPEPRITLTAPVLRHAKHVHILLTGKPKRDAYDTACSAGSQELAPVRVVLGRADVHWAA